MNLASSLTHKLVRFFLKLNGDEETWGSKNSSLPEFLNNSCGYVRCGSVGYRRQVPMSGTGAAGLCWLSHQGHLCHDEKNAVVDMVLLVVLGGDNGTVQRKEKKDYFWISNPPFSFSNMCKSVQYKSFKDVKIQLSPEWNVSSDPDGGWLSPDFSE